MAKKAGKKKMFDAVVGNPPYNTPRSAANNQTKDLYLDFIHCGSTLSDNVTMVTPSRWFAKNSGGNKQLREKMIHEYGLKEIVTVDSEETFGIKIEGGVSYFILKRGYNSLTTFDNQSIDLKNTVQKYGLITIDTDPRVNFALDLIEIHGNVTAIFNGETTFNIATNYKSTNSGVPCLFSRQKGGMGFVDRDDIRNAHLIDKWKVVFQSANGAAGPRLKSKDVFKIDAGHVVSQSFVFFSFDTESERDMFFDYIASDNALDLIAKCKIKQHVNKEVFRLVPNIRDASLLNSPEQAAEKDAYSVNHLDLS